MMSYAGKTVGLWVWGRYEKTSAIRRNRSRHGPTGRCFCDIPWKILRLIRLLIVSYIVIVGYAVGYSGQFKLPTIIRPGFPIHRFLGKVNLVLHGCAIAIALALPPLTNFQGTTALTYLSALFVAVSLAIYRWRPLSLYVLLFRPQGKRGKPLAEQAHTRWPYVLLCTVGYILMLIYIQTIFGSYW